MSGKATDDQSVPYSEGITLNLASSSSSQDSNVKTKIDEPAPPRPDTEGSVQGRGLRPVVLFPSLAGSVLECEESPIEGYAGTRIWMGLSSLLAGRGGETIKLEDTSGSSHQSSHPFVQHLVLDQTQPGQDISGFKVRAKPGLDGCEYLSDVVGVKGGTVILGVITNRLRKHGYTEWDGVSGNMIGASYDWRLMPGQLETRDKFFSGIMKQLEAMVAADPEHLPATVVGFSLGCRVAKYFLHFCLSQKGQEWVSKHVDHFVPLGGPWLGAVQLMKAVMIDGSFEPLDLLFTESEMLTILRSVPAADWELARRA